MTKRQHNKPDRRKYSSAATNAKKSAGGKAAKKINNNAFEPRKSKKDTGLQARIELVVRMAREREKQGESGNAHDVVAHLPFKFNRKATKVG